MNTKTERLYETDSYCREFIARVIACDFRDDAYFTVLDKTAFFPEGGGQNSDVGTLNGIEVLDVQIVDGVIFHKIREEISAGCEVVGKIDWNLRFSRMQNHSGEHILSGIVNSLYGYNNVGFHMSESVMTVDFDGVLAQEDVDKVEKLVNEAIYKNFDIRISHPNDKEASRISYRSKLENIENLRLVTIDGLDICACCAPHVAKTGEIGLVKIIDFTPNKGGVRLTVKAGIDALNDYNDLNKANKQMMKALSVSRTLVSDAAERQIELINKLKYENEIISNRLAWAELKPTFLAGSAYAIAENLTYEQLRYCVNMLSENGIKSCMIFSSDDAENYIYVVSNTECDTRPTVRALNEKFNGKGGGKPNYAQGKIVCNNPNDIRCLAESMLNR